MTIYEKILYYTGIAHRGLVDGNIIVRHCKFFSFDEGLKFIVDGNRIKLLPLKHSALYQKDEFWIHVSPEKKRVLYYAYDMSGNKHVNEVDGHMEWDEVEDCIYNFLVMNIKDITGTELVPGKLTKTPNELRELMDAHGGPEGIMLRGKSEYSLERPCPQAYYGVGDCSCGKCKSHVRPTNRNPFGY